jgi:hypothetical protein
MGSARMRKVYIITCTSGRGDNLDVKLRFTAWSSETAAGFRERHRRVANQVFDALANTFGALNTNFTKE